MKLRALVCFVVLDLSLVSGQLGASPGTDIRIGSPREYAEQVILDVDRETKRLFSVVRWESGWSLNLSTDEGGSWTEVYFEPWDLIDLDLAIVGDWVYVGLLPDYSPTALLRRFAVDDGAIDDTYGTQVILDVMPYTIGEIALESNQDDVDNRIYCALLVGPGTIRTFWDTWWDGTTFTEMPISISDASRGLDLHWNHLFQDHFLFLSYVSQGQVRVWRYDIEMGWSQVKSWPYDGWGQRTALSAWRDFVVVAFLFEAASGEDGVIVLRSADAGDSWAVEEVQSPLMGEGSCHDVDVTVRGDHGTAVAYTHGTLSDHDATVRLRPGYLPTATWLEPEPFSDHEVFVRSSIAVSWSPPYGFAAAYLTWPEGIPYLDRIPVPLFHDDFESGDTVSWSLTRP